jgi:hypothetical protein
MNKGHGTQIVFIVIILYCVSSINVLILSFGVLPYVPQVVYIDPAVFVGFTLFSVALTLVMSVYHVSTMIRGNKRRTDRATVADKQAA